MTDYDVLGRPTTVYMADVHGSGGAVSFGSYGSRTAARQTMDYSGLVTVTSNDKLQTRKEEKSADGQVARVTDSRVF
jgi:hypothetical protein